jgi:ABC-type polysaccharide/polyol phosphate transport system ATPase subunit
VGPEPAVIEMRGVSKRYLLGQDHAVSGSFKESVGAFARGLLPGLKRPERAEIWSLLDIDLTVRAGEALGIVGRNGAGKSTLLKILARITEPTRGMSRTRGRVGSLLEVGTGFHPELTGRENVFLSGVIHGMSRRQIAAVFDEIVDFAGVGQFMDTPVKRYSSGMYLRLAFGVAAHLDADILLVDEVLAVGDAEFQKRCLGRMAEIEHSGRTVVFVSHDLDAIQRLCGRAIWLEHGRVTAEGAPSEVIDRYLGADLRRVGEVVLAGRPEERVAVARVAVLNPAGVPADVLDRDQGFRIEIDLVVSEPTTGLDVSTYVSNNRGVRIIDEALSDHRDLIGGTGTFRATVTIPPVLNVGEYSVGIWVGSGYEERVWRDDVLRFSLVGDSQARLERLVQLNPEWSLEARAGTEPRR